MNVGEILGLEGNSLLLADARRRWQGWQAENSRLATVASYDDLGPKLRSAPAEEADQIRLALAMLAAPDGADDIAAAAALASTLVPGASVLAARLTRMASSHYVTGGPRALVNELVAAQLWIEVRSFPWRRLTRVSGNILMSCRAAVMLELGDLHQLERHDRTWARTSTVDAEVMESADARPVSGAIYRDPSVQMVGEGPTPAEEVSFVLDWACENDVINDVDRRLIVVLLEQAQHVDIRDTTRGRANLCGGKLAERVAPLVGMSPATVRRRAAMTVQALMDAVPSELCA